MRIEGVVIVNAVIDEDGNTQVNDVETDGRAGQEVLALAAERALGRWKFEPGRVNGDPLPVGLRVRVRFTLN